MKRLIAVASVCAAAWAVVAANVTPARALSADDLIGRWCGTGATAATYTFTVKALTVTFTGNRPQRVMPIHSIEVGDDWISVFWSADKKSSTLFQEFTDKGMVQAKEDIGDKGPRREFHRC